MNVAMVCVHPAAIHYIILLKVKCHYLWLQHTLIQDYQMCNPGSSDVTQDHQLCNSGSSDV